MATSRSPAQSAPDDRQEQAFNALGRIHFAIVSDEVARGGLPPIEADPLLDNDTPEIMAMFRRRLFGVRRLPRRERQAALRAAREWLILMLRAAREIRERERNARYTTTRLLRLLRLASPQRPHP